MECGVDEYEESDERLSDSGVVGFDFGSEKKEKLLKIDKKFLKLEKTVKKKI